MVNANAWNRWSAACRLLAAACLLAWLAGVAAPAVAAPAQVTLAIVTAGGGRVTSDIGGIDCGSDCVATFNAGTAVELTATADSGYVFVHWQSDACDSGSDICAHCDATPVCDVTLLAATEMRAVFRDPSRSAGAFVVSPDDTVAFGKVQLGDPARSLTITITNIGGTGTLRLLTLDGMEDFAVTGGSCLPMPRQLLGDRSCTLVAAFSPVIAGSRHASVRITDDGIPHPLLIALTGIGIAGPSTGATAVVKEYFNAALHHYFMTANPQEQAALGVAPFADWQPTGRSFNAYDATQSPPAASAPVCRFFNDHFAGISTHFYGLPDACADVLADFPDWTLESSAAFALFAPGADGVCPDGTDPVYRLFNNGMGGAPNHRFVTSLDDRAAMIAQGYTPEGAGPLGVAMCAPQ
jgi:hypothetical protein